MKCPYTFHCGLLAAGGEARDTHSAEAGSDSSAETPSLVPNGFERYGFDMSLKPQESVGRSKAIAEGYALGLAFNRWVGS